MLGFEIIPALKGPLLWAALGSLLLLLLPVRFLSLGEFSVNGQPVGQAYRLIYVLAVGYSTVVFLTTLFTLCLCLDRTGPHYLRNNDLLVLSRAVGRPAFYLAKMASVLLPSLVFAALGLTVLWEELFRVAGVNVYRILLLILPLALSMACLVSLYFLMRNFLGNFMIFFLWLLLLPILYVANLWKYYGGALREGSAHFSVVGLLPQFGGLHAHALGMVHDFFRRDESWQAMGNGALWTALALAAGLLVFSRKRL